MTDTVSNLDWWITRVGDGAVVWALCVGLAVFVRLDRKCWSWAELALLVLVVSTSGALYWCLALSLSVFTILVIDSLNIWQWPSVPPSAELDEIFPEQKDLIAQFRESAIRNEHYALRYGTITALAMAAVLVLFQLPKCPSDPWIGFFGQVAKKEGPSYTVEGTTITLADDRPTFIKPVSYICLPDTVDPRGAKGK
jgi:hypothetical protein